MARPEESPSRTSAEVGKPPQDATASRVSRVRRGTAIASSVLFGAEPNTGILDRTARVVVGAFLLALVFVGPEVPWGLVGIVPLVTGVSGTCPIYRALGVSTARPSLH
jgi:hypothetical protein